MTEDFDTSTQPENENDVLPTGAPPADTAGESPASGFRDYLQSFFLSEAGPRAPTPETSEPAAAALDAFGPPVPREQVAQPDTPEPVTPVAEPPVWAAGFDAADADRAYVFGEEVLSRPGHLPQSHDEDTVSDAIETAKEFLSNSRDPADPSYAAQTHDDMTVSDAIASAKRFIAHEHDPALPPSPVPMAELSAARADTTEDTTASITENISGDTSENPSGDSREPGGSLYAGPSAETRDEPTLSAAVAREDMSPVTDSGSAAPDPAMTDAADRGHNPEPPAGPETTEARNPFPLMPSYTQPTPPAAPWAVDSARTPQPGAPLPPVGTAPADAPPGTPAADPLFTARQKPKRQWGWAVAVISLFLAAVFLTTVVVLTATRMELRMAYGADGRIHLYSQSEDVPPPVIPAPSPTVSPEEAAPSAEPAVTDRNPLDASGGTKMEILEHPGASPSAVVGQPLSVREIAEKGMPSVVGIVAGEESDYEMSTGSGIIMTSDGYILTNNHVVAGFKTIKVVLSNGDQRQVTQARMDRNSDLAVLKIEATGLTAAEFGNSDRMAIGDPAVVIGCPMGMELQSTVTDGIVSAINRDIVVDDVRMTMLQTNCAINPGNSGGPLFNEYGQVVGVISSKIMSDYFSSYTAEGLGFAIPMNVAKPIVDELITRGYIKGRPAIGILGRALDERTARSLGVPLGFQITEIDPNCDAAKRGLQVDDVITKVNGQNVLTVSDINLIKNDLHVGDELTVTVYRPSARRVMDFTFVLMDSGEISG